jgi:uncharacterized protein (TIGR00369 family)
MPDFQPRHPDYAARVAESLASQAFMHEVLGARVRAVRPGEVEIEAAARPALQQPAGHAHGSVLVALADSATGYAAQTLLAAGFDIVTVELKFNFMAPAFGERYVARGRVLRQGRTLSVCVGDVFALIAGEETHVACIQTTMMAVPVHAG